MSAADVAPEIGDLLTEFRDGLRAILAGVYLYGSYARREAGRESDVDILVILDEMAGYAAEVNRTGELASDVSLKYGVSVSRVFVSRPDWQRAANVFIRSVRGEAVPI